MKSKRILYLFTISVLIVSVVISSCGPDTSTPEATGKVEPTSIPKETEEPKEEPTEEPQVEPVEEGPFFGGTLVIGIKPEIVNVDGTKAGHSTLDGLLEHIVETLVSKDAEGKIQPLLATEWTVSEDGTTWTFKLREGVTFHDGLPFNAEAVRLTFQRMLNPDFGLARGSFYTAVTEVEVVDDYTVKIITGEPWGPFLSYLSYNAAGITSPTLADKKDFDVLIGTGPYKLESWNPGEQTVLVKNENYWGQEPYLDKIIYREIPDDEARIALLETGEIDVALAAPPQLITQFEDNPDFVVVSMPTEEGLSLDIVVGREPTDDVRVRQAILYALDMDAIVEGVMFGSAVPNNAFPSCAPAVTGCYEIPDYHKYDPDTARELLIDAGYTEGIDVQLLYPAPRYNRHIEILTAMQAQLKEVDINLELVSMEFGAFSQEYRRPLEETTFHMISWAWVSYIGDIAFGVNARIPSSKAPPACCNLMFYQSEEADELVAAADRETDPVKRDETLKNLQLLLYEDLPIISLLRYNLVAVHSAKVHDIQYTPGNDHSFAKAWKEQ